jgi:hypothetical protein
MGMNQEVGLIIMERAFPPEQAANPGQDCGDHHFVLYFSRFYETLFLSTLLCITISTKPR